MPGLVDNVERHRTGVRIQEIENFTHFSFDLFGALAFDDGVIAVEQELPEMINLVTFPVIDAGLQIVHGPNSFFSVYRFVCTFQNCFGSFLAIEQILPTCLIEAALVMKLLYRISGRSRPGSQKEAYLQ